VVNTTFGVVYHEATFQIRRRQQRPTLPLVEATAVGSSLYSISKAFRPDFEARGAQERAQDRDHAVPRLHSTVFGSRPQ
jgi:hypothetical protein